MIRNFANLDCIRRLFPVGWFILMGFPGMTQWSKDPKTNLVISDPSWDNWNVSVSPTTSGGTYISWYTMGAGDYVSLSYLDRLGCFGWSPRILAVSPQKRMPGFEFYSLATDREDNALIAFTDSRPGNYDITLSKVSPAGQFLWGKDGITINNPGADEWYTSLSVTLENFVLIGTQSSIWAKGNGWHSWISLQMIDPEGNKTWGPVGIEIADSVKSLEMPFVVSYPDESCAVIYYSRVEAGNDLIKKELLINRFDRNGAPLWSGPKILSSQEFFGAWLPPYSVKMGKDNLLYVAWYNHFVSLQCIHPDGRFAYKANGLELSVDDSCSAYSPHVAGVDSYGNVYVFWTVQDYPIYKQHIKGQSVSSFGELLWGSRGRKIVHENSLTGLNVQIVNDSIFVEYEVPGENDTFEKLYVAGFDTAGIPITPATLLNDVLNMKSGVVQSGFSNGQNIYAWADGNNYRRVIKVQNFLTSGSIGPSAIDAFPLGTTSLGYAFDRESGTFSVPGVQEELQLYLYSTMGIKVFEATFSGNCQLSALPAGTYIFSVCSSLSGQILSGKLLW